MEFIESDRFHIEVNIKAPSSDDLAKVHYNYTMLDGSVLLQLVCAASWEFGFFFYHQCSLQGFLTDLEPNVLK